MPNIDYQILAGDDGATINVDTRFEPFIIQLPLPQNGLKVTVKDAFGFADLNPIAIKRLVPSNPELITNGDFSANLTGWTTAGGLTSAWSANFGGSAIITRTGASSQFSQTLTTVAGKRYRCSYQCWAMGGTAGGRTMFKAIDGSGIGGTEIMNVFEDPTRPRLYIGEFVALSTTTTINFQMEVQTSFTTTIDNVSVKLKTEVATDGEDNDDILNKSGQAISYISDGTSWFRISATEGTGNSGIGLFGGGFNGSNLNSIDFIKIGSESNTRSFSTLTVARYSAGSVGALDRAVFAGGDTGAQSAVIDFSSFKSQATAQSFGSLTVARNYPGGVGNLTRGVFAGGNATTYSNPIDFITIATIADAASWGILTQGRYGGQGCGSPTRGIFGGGIQGSGLSSVVMDYITFASAANAVFFGNLSTGRGNTPGATSNATRAVFAGGTNNPGNQASIDYVTIASTGNASNFGNLTSARYVIGSVSNSLRGVFAGGFNGANTSIIDFISIGTLGNAVSFGALQSGGTQSAAGASNSHGGL